MTENLLKSDKGRRKVKRRIWLKESVLILAIFMVILLVYPQFGFAKDMLLVYSGAGMRKPMNKISAAFEKKYGVAVNSSS